MKNFNIILLVALLIISCKKEDTILKYKYSNELNMISCHDSPENQDLINEAMHSFENDLLNAFDPEARFTSRAYSTFLIQLNNNSFKIEEIASNHSLQISKKLKKLNFYNNTNQFDYNSDFSECLFSNIKNESYKTTFISLKKANSLDDKILLPTFQNYYRFLTTDKNLAAIIAFNYYYNDLMILSNEDIKTPKFVPIKKDSDLKPNNKNVPNKNDLDES